jgi:hypothetical protein
MIDKKSATKRIAVFTIIIASLLISMPLIMSGNAFAGEEKAVVEEPVFNPFPINDPQLERFFFERDVLGVIEGDFEDNPLFQQGNRNALERDEGFRADE